MIPQMSPYTPELYLPDSYGRYRKYPHSTRTPIPGAGYKVGELVWKEQELNLNGGPPQTFGNYSKVPLRGLGASIARAPLMQPPSRSRDASLVQQRSQAKTAVRPAGGAKLARRGSQASAAPMMMATLAPQKARAQTTLRRSGEQTMAHQGSYATAAPMRGDDDMLGATYDLALPAATSMRLVKQQQQANTMLSPSPNGEGSSNGEGAPEDDGGIPGPEDYGYDVAEEIAKAAEAAQQAAANEQEDEEEEPNFFMRKAGPVPYWAIGLGALAVVGGGTYWYVRSR